MKIIPKADFKRKWVEENSILENDEPALIFTNSKTPVIVIGDGKRPATKCKKIPPFAFIEVVKNELGVNKIYFHKSQDDYNYVKQIIEERTKE